VYDRRSVLFASPSLVLALTIALGGAPAAPAVAQPAPPSGIVFPHEDHGACPFECCQYGRWVATGPVTARRSRAAGAQAAFTVAAGEAVESVDGVVITLRPGRARALATVDVDGVRIGRGEELQVLSYVGEGAYKLVARGRVVVAEVAPAAPAFRLLSRPRTVWWVQLRNRHGETGWSNEPERFGGKDACG
jgi:hypothetical protein